MTPERIAFYFQIGTAIILIPIIITFIAALRKKYFSYKGRADKLLQVTKNLNLTFIEKADNDFFNRTVKFGLLETAKAKKAYNLITGKIDGYQVKMFDLVYAVITGSNIGSNKKKVSTPQNRTVSLIEIKDTKIDYFYLSKKMKQPKIVESIMKHIIKDISGIDVKDKFPRFADEYSIYCSDKSKVYNIVKYELVNKLSQTQFDITITIKGKYLLISTGPDFVPLRIYDRFIKDCMDIASIINN